MLAIVQIRTPSLAGPSSLAIEVHVETTWGHNYTDSVTTDVSALTPAQAITAIKNKVIAWAATAKGGSVTLTAANVWIFGGPQ